MKIIWSTNILFPEAIALLTGKDTSSNASGGWLIGSSELLCKNTENKLVVVSVSDIVTSFTKLVGEKIVYYVFPCKDERRYHPEYEIFWKNIIDNEAPDIVHIHGTEYAHGLAFIRAETGIPTIVSVQGISSAIGEYYTAGLTATQVYKYISLFDILFSGSLYRRAARYIKLGNTVESEYFTKADFVLGRTTFDKSRIRAINPRVRYEKCGEILRPEFYNSEKWEYAKCTPYSIFVSQGNYPIKGLHQLIKAVALMGNKYPKMTIRIGGPNILEKKTLKSRLIRTTYANIIAALLKQYRLESKFVFLGALSAEEMRREYLSANVFICPSSIENSPNSLCEAQILGTPCVASYVGGIPDLIPETSCGYMYRYEEVSMLANLIDNIFVNGEHFDNSKMIAMAESRHDQDGVLFSLIKIYQKALKGN